MYTSTYSIHTVCCMYAIYGIPSTEKSSHCPPLIFFFETAFPSTARGMPSAAWAPMTAGNMGGNMSWILDSARWHFFFFSFKRQRHC